MSVTVAVRIGRLQDADGAVAERELLALPLGGERDVAAFIVIVGGVVERHRRRGHVGETDVAHRAVEAIDAYEHRLRVVAVATLHRQVHVVGAGWTARSRIATSSTAAPR